MNTQVIANVSFNADLNKFVCFINGEQIGASVYPDYFEYHYKRGDRPALNKLDIVKFVHHGADGSTMEVLAVRKAPKNVGITVQMVQAAPKKDVCPHCGNEHFHKNGKDAHSVQRYRCNDKACGKSFKLAV